MGSWQAWSVYLTTLLLDRLSPLSGEPAEGWEWPEKIFHDQSPRKNVASPAGSNPQPPDYQWDPHPTEPPRLACLISPLKHRLWVLIRSTLVLLMSTHNLCFCGEIRNTVDSRYLKIQGTLWNTSRYLYFDISDLQNWGKQLIEQPPLTEWIFNLTPKLEIYWKYCGKEEKLLLGSNFSSFPQYFVACW